jgi:Heterokaryon incompatibility protein (HET)
MASNPGYHYADLQENQIRVLYLLAAKRHEPLRFRLKRHGMDHLPFYHALSYCWGEGESNNECICEDESSSGTLTLTSNLWQALKTMRAETKTTPLWVDQICINQQSQQEKSHQIRLMASIYSRASQVIVWLGEADETTSMVWNLIKNTGDQILRLGEELGPGRLHSPHDPHSAFYPLDLSPADAPSWAGFRKLLQRPWFSRLWVLQEIVLSQTAILVCGNNSVTWRMFSLICTLVDAYDRQFPGEQSHLRGAGTKMTQMALYYAERSGFGGSPELAEGFKNMRSEKKHTRLINLMRNLRNRGVTDAHDKVYGVLGIASDVDPLLFPVNYQEPFRETYAYVSKSFIKIHSDLSVLSLVAVEPFRDPPISGPSILPSWVPDYRFDVSDTNNKRLFNGPKVVNHGPDRFFNSTGSSKASLLLEDRLRLTVKGVLIGRIVQLSDPAGNLTGGVSIGANVCSGGQWSQIARSCATSGVYSPTNEPIDLAYARLRIEDRLREETDAAARRARKRPLLYVPEPAPSSFPSTSDGGLHVEENDNITYRIIYSTTRQRLFVTDSGYMGLAHQGCVVGDFIYLLIGGDMPFVLRRLATGTYQFKGETYVHGIMDGEFLLKHFHDQTEDKEGHKNKQWLNKLGEMPLPFPTETVVLT